jgi:hypothetical protein
VLAIAILAIIGGINFHNPIILKKERIDLSQSIPQLWKWNTPAPDFGAGWNTRATDLGHSTLNSSFEKV